MGTALEPELFFRELFLCVCADIVRFYMIVRISGNWTLVPHCALSGADADFASIGIEQHKCDTHFDPVVHERRPHEI